MIIDLIRRMTEENQQDIPSKQKETAIGIFHIEKRGRERTRVIPLYLTYNDKTKNRKKRQPKKKKKKKCKYIIITSLMT